MSNEFKIQLVEPRNPALHTVASVNPFDDKDANWEEREKEMIQLMKDRFGIGLAAPQLGMGYNMFVMTLSTGEDIGVYNPEILEFSKETVGMEEGCLTFPLLYFIVTRPAKVKVRFQTAEQEVVEDWLEGMDARCFQHEFDHLQGITMWDKRYIVPQVVSEKTYGRNEKVILIKGEETKTIKYKKADKYLNDGWVIQ